MNMNYFVAYPFCQNRKEYSQSKKLGIVWNRTLYVNVSIYTMTKYCEGG